MSSSPVVSSASLDAQLLQAAQDGQIADVDALLASGASVDARDDTRRTPLHRAVRSGHIDVARLLLRHGADVETPNEDGWTALHYASVRNGTLAFLLDQGANIDVRNRLGWTPLHRAAWYAHDGSVRLLLERGASIDAVEVQGRTPLRLATDAGDPATVRVLMAAGAIADPAWPSPSSDVKRILCLDRLEAAVETGLPILVERVIEDMASRLSPDEVTSRLRAAARHASDQGQPQVAALLHAALAIQAIGDSMASPVAIRPL